MVFHSVGKKPNADLIGVRTAGVFLEALGGSLFLAFSSFKRPPTLFGSWPSSSTFKASHVVSL
jgi:hypothetical protein